MSLQPSSVSLVPETTAQVAHAAFPDGNPYLQLRDQLGTLFIDTDFADLYPRRGQPALGPGGWPWSPSSSSVRTSPTVGLPTRSAPGSIGSICWASS